MFNEDEDWNDEQDAQALSKTVLRNTAKANSSTNVKSNVGKKSLLRTLQTLGTVPKWNSVDDQWDSDSDTQASPSHSKKKKNRRKKRKHAEISLNQQENEDLDHDVTEQSAVTKMRKKDNKFAAPKTKNTFADKTKDIEDTKSAKVEVNETKDTTRLNRQRWKNKMKNKRKCKNKYRQNTTKEKVQISECADKQGPKEKVEMHSFIKNNSEKTTHTASLTNRKDKECKLQKKNASKEDPKEKKTKNGLLEKGATKSCADRSKQKAGEPEVEVTGDQKKSPIMKRLKPELSKEQSRIRDKLLKMLHSQKKVQHNSPAEHKSEPVAIEEDIKQDRSASLRSRMEQRLESARFRYINEILYCTSSVEAMRMFRQDPQAFWIYHRGYTAQVQRWPASPVDAIITYIQQKSSSLIVADFGCGDCKIARSVKNKVHSFDLAATCELVTVCDMANVPLDDSSVDIAVFCLSLMGTNLADFISEANRVLKMGGVLKIAEVASRFDNVRSFITAFSSLGFKMVSKDTENTHFYSFEFLKTGNPPENVKKYGLQLKPCVYKKR